MTLISSSPGRCDFPLEIDDTFQPITNLTGSVDVIDDPSMLRLIRKTAVLTRIFPTLDLSIAEKDE